MNLLGVVDEDPFDFRTWSGSSAYFFSALRAAGLLAGAVSAQPPRWIERLYMLRNFNVDIERWRFAYHLDAGLAGVRTRVGLRRMSPLWEETDCILQVGALFDFAGKGKPAVSYHDGNLARRLDNPYGYPCVSQRVIDRSLAYERQLYQRLDRIFTMSRWLADSFVNDFGVSPDRVQPIYAGINMPDVETFSVANYSGKRLLFVGKQFERKGGKVLLDAFRLVRKKVPDATLTIVGPELSNLPDGVFNPGFVSKSTPEGLAAVKRMYAESSVFVLPTLYEPFGISYVEAMAHGLPCVGSNLCAVPEIIEEGASGYLVQPGDATSLAGRLIELLEDPGRSAEFGRRGFERYRAQFRWEVVARNLMAGLSELA